MSMSLYLWKAPVIDDSDEALALVDRYYDDEDVAVFEPSDSVSRALAKIRELYPDDPGSDDNPWSSWPIEDSDRIIELNVRWSVDGEVLDAIIDIAAENDLVVYDPQGPDVYRAVDALVDSGPTPPPTLLDAIKMLPMALIGIAVTYAAWLIPIGWLRWPAVIVAAFLTSAAVFVVGLMFGGALGLIKNED